MSTLFIDESKTRRYTVVAAVVLPADVRRYKRAINELRMKGQRRLHFVTESPARRRQILSELTRLNVRARAYRADAGSDAASRDACLTAMVADLGVTASRIVLEQDDSTVLADRQLLYRELHALGRADVSYRHERAVNEPLLAIPDALAWCIARGGEWRSRVEPLLTQVTDVTG